jgi:Tfp pilus assembly protein FimV
VIALVLGVLLIDRTAEAGSISRPVPVTYRVVLPGETLWQIAGEVAPGVDRRDTVARLLELNALSTAGVRAGQRIAVPVHAP